MPLALGCAACGDTSVGEPSIWSEAGVVINRCCGADCVRCCGEPREVGDLMLKVPPAELPKDVRLPATSDGSPLLKVTK
eukprot:COSAG02_NODE_5169_length_4575_cov_2.130920_9_plen_79_part_00